MLLSKSIFEKIRSYVLLMDQEGRIILANKSFNALSGIDFNHIEGQYVWDFIKPFHKGSRKTELIVKKKILLKKGASVQFETHLELGERGEKYILWDLSFDEENRYILVGNDITERKNIERQLKQKNKNLQENQKDILDSVNYARKLQEAILPASGKLNEYLGEGFVLYKPKDIVS